MSEPENITHRLRKRAEIRRAITSRKSVQDGASDRISDLLEEAADEITELRKVKTLQVSASRGSLYAFMAGLGEGYLNRIQITAKSEAESSVARKKVHDITEKALSILYELGRKVDE